jgi:hypothetical protein
MRPLDVHLQCHVGGSICCDRHGSGLCSRSGILGDMPQLPRQPLRTALAAARMF